MSEMLPRLFEEDFFGGFDPFGDFRMLPHRDRVFGKHAERLMKTDIHETDDAYKFLIDLPGFKKEDVNAELKDGYLTVTAQKAHDDETKSESGRLLRRERYTGSCQRSFYVGDAVSEKDCKAGFENGILSIEVPKVQSVAHDERKLIAIA